MTDFYVNGKNGRGCRGFDVGNTRYDADRNGRVVVDNPDHARLVEATKYGDGGYIQKAVGMPSSKTPSKKCRSCTFIGFKWQTACPKCGDILELEGTP